MNVHGRADVKLHTFFTAAIERGEWSISGHGRSNPGRKPWCPLNRKLGEPKGRGGRFGEEINFFFLPEIERRLVGCHSGCGVSVQLHGYAYADFGGLLYCIL